MTEQCKKFSHRLYQAHDLLPVEGKVAVLVSFSPLLAEVLEFLVFHLAGRGQTNAQAQTQAHAHAHFHCQPVGVVDPDTTNDTHTRFSQQSAEKQAVIYLVENGNSIQSTRGAENMTVVCEHTVPLPAKTVRVWKQDIDTWRRYALPFTPCLLHVQELLRYVATTLMWIPDTASLCRNTDTHANQ